MARSVIAAKRQSAAVRYSSLTTMTRGDYQKRNSRVSIGRSLAAGLGPPARVLGISTATVINELKQRGLHSSQLKRRSAAIKAPDTVVILHKIDAAKLDERGSDGGSQAEPRWLGQALDHHTGQVLA